MNDFIHLHVHSEYSLLDGYAPIKKITARAAELGMDSIALTDHGVMYGVIEFYEAARKADIKPIVGVEAYLTSGAHTAQKGETYHQVLLARNATGYRNLVKLTTRAHLEGFWRRPRIDQDLLMQHSEGLIATSSCLAGEIPQLLLKGEKQRARERAAFYRDLFGADNYYLELQLHDNTPELPEVNAELVRIGKELGIPLVATNDTHFVRPEDLDTQHMVMAMSFGVTLDEFCNPRAGKKSYKMDQTYHIMSADEMWQRFKPYGAEPLENTRRIADMCNLELEFGRVQLPEFEIPEGHDASSYLRLLCEEGLMRRCNGHPPEEYIKRLADELDVINATGFPDYMLIVWDYVKFARGRGIPCLPRGSAGASLVLYCLGITEVDPVANKLLFERFLSRERLEMPDIDTDFADSRRHEVLDYIAEKYGRDNTAQIITYGTLGAKAALRDVGRVLDVPLNEVDRVAKLVPSLPVGTTIAKALDRVPDLRQIYEQDDKLREVIDRAQLVEGRMRSVGTHACGVVVSRSSLDEIVPLQRTTKDDSAVMASYEGPALAKIGLLKMDILGLTNLSIVANTVDYIQQTTGQRIELDDIPLDDQKTFVSLGRGETVNVFQFESTGMTRYLRELKPTRVQDLYAMVALYRPGPLEQIPVYIRNKNNPNQITYLHPILEPILEDTYGVIVYQEQIMQLLQAIAGYTLGRAYVVLKAIGKKKRDLMAQEEPRFKEGCLKNGLTQAQADQLWDLIQPFAGYSFNRPHSTLYGLLSYQTAYLKNNYSAQYMAAVLDAAAGSIEDVAKAVAECARLGVVVLPVNINVSAAGFTFQTLPDDYIQTHNSQAYAIRFGLSAVKNVGSGPVEAIIAAREAGGPFQSVEDFCTRVDRHVATKRVLEALIKAGAMDDLPGTRRQKLGILDTAVSAGAEAQRAKEAGQTSLFDLFGDTGSTQEMQVASIAMPTIIETPEMQKEQLAWEKELLGMYVSAHPVAQALAGVDTSGTTPLGQINSEHVGQSLSFIGLVTGVRRVTTKKGDAMLVAVLEDLESSIEMVAFPRVLEKHKDLLDDDAVLRITGKVDNRRDTLQLIIEECSEVEQIQLAANAEAGEELTEAATDAAESEGGDALILSEERTVSLETTEAMGQTPPPHVVEATAPNTSTAQPVDEPVQVSGAEIRPVEGPINAIKSRTRVSLPKPEPTASAPALTASGNGDTVHAGGAATPRHDLQLVLPHTDDLGADTRCMQDAHDLLTRYEGGDAQITLYLRNGIGTVVLRPHYQVRLSNELLLSLQQLLGEDNVTQAKL